MKKRILGFLSALFLIAGLAQSGAAATYSSWILDLDGDGNTATGEQVSVTEYIDINSPNLVLATMDTGSTTNYTFSDIGVTSATDVDSSGTTDDKINLFSLTGDYLFTGDGELGSGVAFNQGGQLNLKVGDTLVATLTLIEGEGSVNEEGFPNGQLSISYDLEVLSLGYLLWEDGTSITSATALTTTNASEIATPSAELDKILLTAAGIDPNDKETALEAYDFYYYLSSNGQFRLTNEVPVPSALFLLGSGIIGLVGFRRKNS